MIISAQQVLNDHSTFAFLRVPEVNPSELVLLSAHPDSAVRVAALNLIKKEMIPVFMGDSNKAIQELISKRLKSG